MQRSYIKKSGKIAQANTKARKIIAEKCQELELNYCEIAFNKDVQCLGTSFLAPAHKHKRAWYKGDVELLADYNEWVAACQNCHNHMEFNPKLTEEVFERLRGNV